MSQRILMEHVGIRFRMSYHKVYSSRQLLSEIGRRIAKQWEPEYFSALNDISLEIHTGEIVGVIGRNGAGKSTLLRTISGIYYQDSGNISVSGRVSALLQLGTGFNTELSGRENIILGGLTLGLTYTEVVDRMDEIIEFAELGEFIDIPMRYYSSGMMGRLSFAMVISIEPDILLIDETLSVGDLEFQEKSQKAMRRLIDNASCQMIVSHSLETISELCTRVILLESGKIIADDKPDTVIKEYADVVRDRPRPTAAKQINKFYSNAA